MKGECYKCKTPDVKVWNTLRRKHGNKKYKQQGG
jgi:hypothetical protein